jgi:tripartite-type tricarboxylate transporter receptor subunit TctC
MENVMTLSACDCRILCLAAALGSTAAAWAQDRFPSRPIEMVVNFGAGGGADQLGRIAAKLMEPSLGVPLPVVNVSGASGNSGLARVATAHPDGYTIGTLTGISVSAWASGMGQLKLDDYAHLGVVQSSPSMLFVPIDGPVRSFKQLLELSRLQPESIKVATAGIGTLDDFALRYLASKGHAMVNVPYAKPGERYTSVLGKHTDVLFEEPGDVAPFLDSRQLVPIVVFGSSRHPSFPDVPASAEFGHAIDLPNWRAIVTSAHVPKERVALLSAALEKALQSDEWKKFCAQTYTCIRKLDPAASRQFAQRNFDDAVRFLQVAAAASK